MIDINGGVDDGSWGVGDDQGVLYRSRSPTFGENEVRIIARRISWRGLAHENPKIARCLLSASVTDLSKGTDPHRPREHVSTPTTMYEGKELGHRIEHRVTMLKQLWEVQVREVRRIRVVLAAGGVVKSSVMSFSVDGFVAFQ